MAGLKRSAHFSVLALAFMLSSALQVSAQAQSQSVEPSLGSLLVNSFRPPKTTVGAPDNRMGGATRRPDSCFVGDQKLTALAPINVGETTAKNPQVFWVMPEMTAENAPAPAVELTLRYVGDHKDDEKNDKKVYSQIYPLSKSAQGVVGTPGVMSVTVATPSYPLEQGQEYKWQLRVTCDATNDIDRSDEQFAEGRIKRVGGEPTLERRLQTASPEQRIALYAQANLWYEMLTDLVKLRSDRPNDRNLADAWEKLFVGVNLTEISDQPQFKGAKTIQN
jgi:hypothetical protein